MLIFTLNPILYLHESNRFRAVELCVQVLDFAASPTKIHILHVFLKFASLPR